jgi:hypothetical protein
MILRDTKISASDQEVRISRRQRRLSINNFHDASPSILKEAIS